MLEAIDDKVAWITGAGSGIGAACARALAGAGAIVVLCGRRPEPLARLAQAIRADGGRAEAAPMDVSRSEEAVRTAAEIRSRHGRLDILVNNAGVNVKPRRLAELGPEDWSRLLEINLNGAFHCVHAALPVMREQRDGLIVNIASWAGRYPSHVAGSAYAASKHGMLALNAGINMEECHNNIRACGICPGEVATPILDQRPQPLAPEVREKLLAPEDIAEAVLFVARLPARVCVNELLISPTYNRGYLHMTGRL